MSKFTKISNTEYEVTCSVKPSGTKDMEGVKGIITTHIFDFSELNPNGLEIPDAIMECAISDAVIAFQGVVRKLVSTRDFDGLSGALKTYGIYKVGEKRAKAPRKSDAEAIRDFVEHLKSEYVGITSSEIVDAIAVSIDPADKAKFEAAMRKKYGSKSQTK